MSSAHPSGRRASSRGGGHGGRNNTHFSGGRGGSSSNRGGVIGPRRGNHGNSNRSQHNGRQSRTRNQQEEGSVMRDEDILIAFMPYLKGNHAEALRIHEEYQMGNDQRAFLRAAREFLAREKQSSDIPSSQTSKPAYVQAQSAVAPAAPRPPSNEPLPMQQQPPAAPSTFLSPQPNKSNDMPISTSLFNSNPISHQTIFSQQRPHPPTNVLPQPGNQHRLLPRQQPHHTMVFPGQQLPLQPRHPTMRESSIDSLQMHSIERGLDALMREDPPAVAAMAATTPTPANHSIWVSSVSNPTPPVTPPRESFPRTDHSTASTPQGPNTPQSSVWSHGTPQPSSQDQTPPPTQQTASPPTMLQTMDPVVSDSGAAKAIVDAAEIQRIPRKEAPPPKRLWTHPEEQPGKVLVKGYGGEDYSLILQFAPREELTAYWILSLAYLRKCAVEKFGPTANLETLLAKLSLGLFRRGCTENGMQASIVSKSVLGEYWRDAATETVRGKVPFYSPRTPGHVVFRLFWEDEPLHTLATGPAILVRVVEVDFESSVRFILSNFKGKKSNPTSLSSLHSLATILETHITRPNESAARATWGCIQEARKVLEACAHEHEKTTAKLSVLEDEVEDLKLQVEQEEALSHGTDDVDGNSQDIPEAGQSEASSTLREKVRALMSGRASCERKWRDSQLAFAGILKAVVSNQSMAVLLRRDLIAKMRVEFELWCPLSEEFAIPNDTASIWFEALRDLHPVISAEDFQNYAQARVKMQMRTLGFDPNTLSLEDVLFPRNRSAPTQRSMDPGAVNVFNNVSSAMGKFFQTLYKDEETVGRRRELIRQRTEECIKASGAFPPGTQVIIFGSSANGFGSPKSDLDMCLQLPNGTKIDEHDDSGAAAMAKLKDAFEEAGMSEIDTTRLTARIPVIKYCCPDPLPSTEGEPALFECDLSMHNPLAVLNTTLLRAYAEITPVTRVLAAIVKRWAKARDINNPARHTLSSYGYIIMLLHFLTYHKRTGNGLVSPVAPPHGDPSHRQLGILRPSPLLPNLQWMDPTWPSSPRGTPYRELPNPPKYVIAHPLENSKTVNAHFFRPNSQNQAALLQVLFPGHDLSLAILLASFFRYYAYEFDYKRFVVSLHSTSSRGLVEREVKAELDGWRNYSAALTIEDPFETFYDVAHVLRGGYYHRIRREFAVAYTKIADAATGRPGSWNKGDLRSLSGEELMDWLCEPIEKERVEEAS